ncbi:ABC transporter substrate-binding protein [Microlunatus endophyticus]|uniref:ABC transporter substrate-binding protein n=1 Tax=Microlunatus endophyticus TaxID=1716077 RepID=UPI001E491E5E|nr:extracellular solute-binding protein [Microlunatus endophyticus]
MSAGKIRFLIGSLTAATLVGLAACGGGGSGGSSGSASSPAAPATSASAGGDLKGQSFTILGQWTGGEQKAFQAVLDKFDSETGATGHYTPAAGGDEATVLGTKVAGGTPPDVAILSLPGAIAQYASSGDLKPATSAMQQATKDNYSSEWATLGSYKGKLYGVPVDASNKSTLWYNNKLFGNAGITKPPATWQDLIKDSKTLSDSGVTTPISVGGGDGWTLSDWFENVYIRTAGLANYDKLTKHQIPWTDPTVTTALNTLKQIWGDKQLVGDPAQAVKVPFTGSVDNTFKANPSSAIVYEASFVATTITSDKLPAKVGTDAKVASFPSINGSKPVVEAAGDFAVGFTDNKAAQQFMAYLGGKEASAILVGTQGSGFISANKNLTASDYADPTSAQLGQQIVSVGDNFRFDMSDQAPAAFGGTPNKGEWGDLQTFLTDGDVKAAQKQLEKDAKAVKWQ